MLLEEKTAKRLISAEKTLAIAESCTGGLLSARLTSIPGSSRFLKAGLVTYSNESKMKLLKIPQKILKRHGAVSQIVAEMMAKNVRKTFKTDFGIGITGIAGPDGATKHKPVGLTFITVSTATESLTLECLFNGNRTSVRSQAVRTALKLLLEFLV